jgi:hypothetical protein
MSNKGFLLAEDAAVKNRFSNLTVSDDRNQDRQVQVFFRYPEGETEKAYPFITVEMIGMSHDTRRQLSETTYYYRVRASIGDLPWGIAEWQNVNIQWQLITETYN